MKSTYKRPLVFIEEFTPNNAIAACGSDTTVIFDCMAGPNKDTENVLSAAGGVNGCDIDAGYAAGCSIAINSGNRHSEYNDKLIWDTTTRNQVKATASGSPAGMLYICAAKMSGNTKNDYSTSAWTVSTPTITHNEHENCTHPMIAPVYGADANSVATS